jgi:hypothetical protein
MQLPGAVRKTFIVMGAAVQVLGGCGSPPANRADVEGTVTLGGMPLDQGSIMFVPAEGTRGLVAGGPIDGGRYRLTGKAGVAIGRNVVEISAPRSTGRKIQRYGPGTTAVEEIVERVAARFNTNSTLIVDVEAGLNTFDFELAED